MGIAGMSLLRASLGEEVGSAVAAAVGYEYADREIVLAIIGGLW